jgi:hypothetical protein
MSLEYIALLIVCAIAFVVGMYGIIQTLKL